MIVLNRIIGYNNKIQAGILPQIFLIGTFSEENSMMMPIRCFWIAPVSSFEGNFLYFLDAVHLPYLYWVKTS